MAFVNRIGSILKQTVSKHINAELSASNTSLYQAIRCMSSSKLFVGGLSYGTDEMSLREAFTQYGEVIEARIVMDRETGRSRGFGFISFTSSEEASNAMQAMDGQDLHGRQVRVNYATEKPRGGGFGGYGGGGGGYGGGYGNSNYGSGGGNYGSGGSGNYGGGNSGGYGQYGGGSNSGNYGVSGGGSGSDSGFTNPGYGGNLGASYGGSNNGNYSGSGGGENFFSGGSGSDSGFAKTGYDGNKGSSYGGGEEQFGGNQGRADGGTEGFGHNMSEASYRDDDNDEPRGYANTRN